MPATLYPANDKPHPYVGDPILPEWGHYCPPYYVPKIPWGRTYPKPLPYPDIASPNLPRVPMSTTSAPDNPQDQFIASVRHEIRRLGHDDTKVTDDQIRNIGVKSDVPAAVMVYDPTHPVFGAFGDGHVLQWIITNWKTIVQVAKIVVQVFILVAPLLAAGS